MSSSPFLSFAGIVGIIFGVLMLAIPVQFLSFYGAPDPLSLIGLTRGYGASVLGMGLIAWGAKDVDAGVALNAILLGIFAAGLLGALNSIYGVTSGQIGPMGWINVAIQGALALGSGYLRFLK